MFRIVLALAILAGCLVVPAEAGRWFRRSACGPACQSQAAAQKTPAAVQKSGTKATQKGWRLRLFGRKR